MIFHHHHHHHHHHHGLDMNLAVAEALSPNKPEPNLILVIYCRSYTREPCPCLSPCSTTVTSRRTTRRPSVCGRWPSTPRLRNSFRRNPDAWMPLRCTQLTKFSGSGRLPRERCGSWKTRMRTRRNWEREKVRTAGDITGSVCFS